MFSVLVFMVALQGLIIPFASGNDENAEMKKIISSLGRQTMMLQLQLEERVRSDGDSGIKMIRLQNKATNPYLERTFTRRSDMSIHDHSNNIRTVGMGEVVVVLNGVEFRTRHNDYRLYMPSNSSNTYHEVEDIPFPGVPPEVSSKPTFKEQIDEMRLWFKAFKEQNYTERDYRKYFKPILCYLEGAWTYSDGHNIDEPFNSDRHHIDATSWFDLQEKIRFTSGTGSKNLLENFAFLPTTIGRLINDTVPTLAQWNYRILCHPLQRDLPLNRFRLVDDFTSRMTRQYSMAQHERTRAARFQLNPHDSDTWPNKEISFDYGLLDELMYEIPGKDNYVANLSDTSFDTTTSTADNRPLNAGFYHRVYKNSRRGAMGLTLVHRGFHDSNAFVAFNSQNKIMPVYFQHCNKRGRNCQEREQRVSYAIPLEIIYLTPLYEWNIYNITYRGDSKTEEADKVTAEETRTGFPSQELAYNGIHSQLYYKTPVEFFTGTEINRDPADTAEDAVGVLDAGMNVRNVTASGTRIFLPLIEGIGTIRTRYPINPVHDEGSVTRKELEAIKMAFLEMGNYMHMMRVPLKNGNTHVAKDTIIKLGPSNSTSVTRHTHTIEITPAELERLEDGEKITKSTSKEESHNHEITFRYRAGRDDFKIIKCDRRATCWDHHPESMKAVEGEEEE